MKPTLVTWVLVAASIVVAGAGVVDAARAGNGDVLALFLALLGIGALQAVRLVVGRPTVTLRADLVRWLAERSQLTGEPLARVTDRAVATYRASLTGSSAERAGPGTPVERDAPTR